MNKVVDGYVAEVQVVLLLYMVEYGGFLFLCLQIGLNDVISVGLTFGLVYDNFLFSSNMVGFYFICSSNDFF